MRAVAALLMAKMDLHYTGVTSQVQNMLSGHAETSLKRDRGMCGGHCLVRMRQKHTFSKIILCNRNAHFFIASQHQLIKSFNNTIQKDDQ